MRIKELIACTALAIGVLVAGAYGQAPKEPDYSKLSPRVANEVASMEQVAMCHHAINAAKALAGKLDAYGTYAINYKLMKAFPDPERCINIADSWIVPYAALSSSDKADEDLFFTSVGGLTIAEMAKDVEFLHKVEDAIAKRGAESKQEH